MQFTWHILIIIALVIIGFYLFKNSYKKSDMSPEQINRTNMNRNNTTVILVAVSEFPILLKLISLQF